MKRAVSFATALLLSFSLSSAWAEILPWEKNDLQLSAELEPFTWFASTQFQQDGTPFDLLTEGSTGAVNAVGSRLMLDFVPFEDFSFFFETEFKSITLVAPDSRARTLGFSDARFGGSYVLTVEPVGFVLGGAITAPTGYSPDLGPFRPALGDGVHVFEAFAQIGKSFENPFFFLLEFGYRLRGTRTPRGGGPPVKFADIIPVILDLGFKVGQRFRFLMMGEMTFALGKPRTIDSVTFVAPAKTHARVGLGGQFFVNDSLQIGGHLKLTMAGKNEFNTTELGLRVTTSLNLKE